MFIRPRTRARLLHPFGGTSREVAGKSATTSAAPTMAQRFSGPVHASVQAHTIVMPAVPVSSSSWAGSIYVPTAVTTRRAAGNSAPRAAALASTARSCLALALSSAASCAASPTLRPPRDDCLFLTLSGVMPAIGFAPCLPSPRHPLPVLLARLFLGIASPTRVYTIWLPEQHSPPVAPARSVLNSVGRFFFVVAMVFILGAGIAPTAVLASPWLCCPCAFHPWRVLGRSGRRRAGAAGVTVFVIGD